MTMDLFKRLTRLAMSDKQRQTIIVLITTNDHEPFTAANTKVASGRLAKSDKQRQRQTINVLITTNNHEPFQAANTTGKVRQTETETYYNSPHYDQ